MTADTPLDNSYEQWNWDIHNVLCHALYQTLIRLCGSTEHTTREELYNIAHESISYPNHGVVAYPEGLGTTNLQTTLGKPHDIEVRVALALYHRWRQKRNQRVVEQPSIPLVDGSSNTTTEQPCHATYVMRIRSDMGIQREFTSERHVAEVIVQTLEERVVDESCSTPSYQDHPCPPDDCPYQGRLGEECCHNISLRTIVSDIRVHPSGIIYITTKARVQQLRSIGRLPCSLCTKWCKGEKGLWWHQQQEHGKYHSEASTEAKLQLDNLAIVPYFESLPNDARNRSQQFHSPQKHPLRTNQGDTSISTRRLPPTCSRDTNYSSANTERPLVDYMDSIKAGDIQRVQLMIEQGLIMDPKMYHDRNGAVAIHWAAGCGHLQLVIYLIETCGCSPQSRQKGKRAYSGRTPLHWASRNGHLNVVQYLVESCFVDLEQATDDGTTAFCWACWQGHLPVIRYLHERGCNIHSVNSFGCNAVLWCAQGDGDLAVVQYLHTIGCKMSSVNCNGHGVLHKAAQRGNGGVCQWFISQVHQCDHEFSSEDLIIRHISPDMEGCCPSDLAGMEGHEELAKYLSANERTFASRFISAPSTLPMWLKSSIEKESISIKHTMEWAQTFWGPGGGVRRIAHLLIRGVNTA